MYRTAALAAFLVVGCATSSPGTAPPTTRPAPATPTTVQPTTTTTVPTYTPGDALPKVVTASYFPTDLVQRVSRFRSGFGHDYSDDFEDCRSMKHYFIADQALDHMVS